MIHTGLSWVLHCKKNHPIAVFYFQIQAQTKCPKRERNKNKVMRDTHHGPAVSRFLVSNGSTNGTGCLRGLLRLIKTHFENISGSPF